MIDGFWNKMVGCCPLVSQALAPETAEPWLPKTLFCRQLLLSEKSSWFYVPNSDLTMVVFITYDSLRSSSRLGRYCASVKANSEHFWMRKTFFPVVLFWWMPTLRPVTLGCQNTLQALIPFTTPIRSRSAALPLFNWQLAWVTGRENAAEGCEALEVFRQFVPVQIFVPPQLNHVLKLFVLV